MSRVFEGSRPPHMLSSSSKSAEGGLVVETFGPASPDVEGALVKDFFGFALEVFLGLAGPPVVAVVFAWAGVEAELPLSGCAASPDGLRNEVATAKLALNIGGWGQKGRA